MIADLKPYSAMKDSGVPWLGAVPEHWEVRRTRNAIDMRVSNIDKHTKEGELPVRLCNYVDVYKHDRITEHMSFMRATATAEEIERFRLEPGDVPITKDSEAWNDIGIPALVEYTAEDLVCGYHLALLRPRKALLSGAYLLRALQSPAVTYQFHVAANGVTRYGLSHDAIKSVLLPIPPTLEQSAIVRYLNYMDQRIRKYIRAKQKLIKLLEEQKLAIIHHAVTRGLDPNVHLKPSGVEWLGEIPDHWEVMPIKRAFLSMEYGISVSASDTGTIRLLTMGHLKDGRVTVPATGGVDSVDSSLLLHAGDLLFNRTNSPGLVGKVGLFVGYESPVTFASYLVRLRPRPNHEPEYLNAILNDTTLLSIARREAIPSLHQSNLNPTRYGRLQVALPPQGEQQEILQVLEQETGDLIKGIIAAQREVALLHEYRTRLIADVVTGKLDVREAAAQLPDEADEPELVDEGDAMSASDDEPVDDLDTAPEEAEA